MKDPIGSDLFQGRYWNDTTSIGAGATAHRLGAGGLFVQTDQAPRAGTLLQFELAIGSEPAVSGVVRVLEAQASAEATADLPAGMRVKFVHLDDPIHAREVLARVVVQPSSSLPPPAETRVDAGSPPSSRAALWDHAVALEEDFFERSAAAPVSISGDEVAESMAARTKDPKYAARQQQLRKTFGAVVLGAAVLFAATAVRGVATGDAPDPTPEQPRAALATPPSVTPPPLAAPPPAETVAFVVPAPAAVPPVSAAPPVPAAPPLAVRPRPPAPTSPPARPPAPVADSIYD